MSSGLVVKNNLSALNTLNTMNKNTSALNKSMSKVSSGLKIRNAADDSSGYQISERMKVQIRSLDQANQNTQNGSSLLSTAAGGVDSTVEILKTLKEKVISAANGTNTDSDLKAIQDEMDQSIDQINDNSNVTFNNQYLSNGSRSGKGSATTSAYVNSSLSTDTLGTTVLTALTDRNGKTLGLVSTDTVTVSYVSNGTTTTTSFQVGTSSTLDDILTKITGADASAATTNYTSDIGVDSGSNSISTADKQNVVTLSAKTAGVTSSISGFSIGVTDSSGNEKKSVDTKLDAFNEKITAADTIAVDSALSLQVGTKSNQTIKVSLSDMSAKALGLQGQDSATGDVNLDVSTKENANAAINTLDAALQRALSEQTKIGAAQSRLDYTSQNLTTSSENVTDAQSTIADADMAKEMTEYSKNSVLQQAAQSMLAQANQSGSGVLSLLK
ncbi:MAG: flagellin domain protein [Firmicutes bacterium]|nr:flagellin domain protein [Bacillota bacterium]